MIARKKFPGSPASLDALCRRFKIDNSSREKHGALLDSELLAEVYLELMGGRQRGLELVDHNQPVISNNVTQEYVKREVPHRKFSANDEEIQKHNDLLEKIADPIWKTV